MEQRINLKFLVKLGKGPTDCLKLLQEVYGEATMSRARLFEWHKRFTSGREEVEDDPKSGWPSTTKTADNIGKVNELVRSDRRLTVRMMAEELNINRESVRIILSEELGMRKMCAKMVPKLLSDDQKQHRVRVCEDTLEEIGADPHFLRHIILEMKLGCSSTTRKPRGRASSGSPQIHKDPRKRACQSQRSRPCWSLSFTKRVWCITSLCLRAKRWTSTFIRKSSNASMTGFAAADQLFGKNKSWMLHHDNAPAHTALSTRQLLANKQVTVLDHPPYSPDLAPCDFWLFPKLKSVVKGLHFASVDEIKDRVTRELRCLAEEDFAGCFQAWQRWMIKCINSGGNYFEGDN